MAGSPAYVVDSHIFGAYLLDQLSGRSDRVFEEAEHERATIIIPSIVIAELIYVYEKAKLRSEIWEMFDRLDAYPSFMVHPLDEPLLKIMADVHLAELHDRIIVATCIHTRAQALITKDQEIRSSKLVRTFC